MPPTSKELETPLHPNDLWLVIENVPLARPLLQGDVFEGLDDQDQSGFDLLITHPCSMRAGRRMRPRQTVVRIAEIQLPRDADAWTRSHYDYAPMFGLEGTVEGDGFPAADFRMIRSVATDQLDRSARVAAMSSEGVYQLQQRLVHYLTRAIIDIPTLTEVSESILVEVDLQEDWVQTHLDRISDVSDIASLEEQFQDLLDADDAKLRRGLAEKHTRPSAIREVNILMRQPGT